MDFNPSRAEDGMLRSQTWAMVSRCLKDARQVRHVWTYLPYFFGCLQNKSSISESEMMTFLLDVWYFFAKMNSQIWPLLPFVSFCSLLRSHHLVGFSNAEALCTSRLSWSNYDLAKVDFISIWLGMNQKMLGWSHLWRSAKSHLTNWSHFGDSSLVANRNTFNGSTLRVWHWSTCVLRCRNELEYGWPMFPLRSLGQHVESLLSSFKILWSIYISWSDVSVPFLRWQWGELWLNLFVKETSWSWRHPIFHWIEIK